MHKLQQISKLLDELSINYRAVNHPAVFTVAESQQHIKDKRPIKNLLLQEKNHGKKILVTMDGDARLDLKAMAKDIGTKKLSFASADVMKETLGVTPGAVSIFGLLNNSPPDVIVVIDKSLLSEKELGFHPNDNTSTIFIPGNSLEKITNHTGHTVHLVDLKEN